MTREEIRAQIRSDLVALIHEALLVPSVGPQNLVDRRIGIMIAPFLAELDRAAADAANLRRLLAVHAQEMEDDLAWFPDGENTVEWRVFHRAQVLAALAQPADRSLLDRLEAAERERDQAQTEAAAILDLIPGAVRVREGGEPENLWASLAVSVAALVALVKEVK